MEKGKFGQYISKPALPICAGCNGLITDDFMENMGKKWHHKHYRCFHCDQAMTDQDVVVWHEDKLYCTADYTALFPPRCAQCQEIIKSKCVSFNGRHYHTDHFVCALCQKAFGKNKFFELDGKAYCKGDFVKMSNGKNWDMYTRVSGGRISGGCSVV